jgi:hypothetical protein
MIFPSRPLASAQGEVDVHYATRPGDPAYQVPDEAVATQKYAGIFTAEVLKVVNAPPSVMVEKLQNGGDTKHVISSRKMKGHLEATVPLLHRTST